MLAPAIPRRARLLLKTPLPLPVASAPRPQNILFWGTLDRRRELNRVVRRVVPRFFPFVEFVDFEALTEGLPADYSFDGEHWGCPHLFWTKRENAPFQCKALANVALGNVLANALCNEALEPLGIEPSIDTHYEGLPAEGSVDWGARLRELREERERQAKGKKHHDGGRGGAGGREGDDDAADGVEG